jgi:23S rRNA pseudouridine1911/1915/1917 synthase
VAGPALVVLYEDNHCLAVLKPAGMLTAGDKTGDVSLLELARQYIKKKYAKPGNVYIGLVHRLDRPVSGVVLFARTSKAAARLSEQFRAGRVRKIYLAWVEGSPPQLEGSMSDLLVKDHRQNISRSAAAESQDTRRAELSFRVCKKDAGRSLLEVRPRTGRSHQIRVQLAARGLPIVGDVKYGAERLDRSEIALHAFELTFDHPVRHEPVCVRAPVPRHWATLTNLSSLP